MIITESPAQKQTAKKKKTARKQPNLALDPAVIYSRQEAARVLRSSESTLIRAYAAGHLQAYITGNRIRHSGQQLLDWLQAGGKTS